MAAKGECHKCFKSALWNELPVKIWKYIVQLVVVASLQSTMKLRCVSKNFNELADDWSTFAVIDLNNFEGGYKFTSSEEADRKVRIFANRCWEAKNLESLFRKRMQVLIQTANILLALEYFDMTCKPRILYWPVNSLMDGHHVAFYAACMIRMMMGTQENQLQIVQQLCNVIDWCKSGGNITYCRYEFKQMLKATESSHRYLISYFPSSHMFIPDNACLVYGESIFWRPFGRNMWHVDGDKHAPKDCCDSEDCCDSCKCFVEMTYVYQLLTYRIPKLPTPFPPSYYEVFRDAYFGREHVVKQFHLLDAKLEQLQTNDLVCFLLQ